MSANIHVFEQGDNITLSAGTVDTASVNGQTFIVNSVLENAIEITPSYGANKFDYKFNSTLTGNANLHVVSVPKGYAVPGMTGTIYDPENNYSLGSNVEALLNPLTDLDIGDKY